MVQLLLDAGADPNFATPNGDGPLLAAAYAGQDAIVAALLAAGADVNAAETEYGWTPLHAAARRGHAACVARLLEAGANPLARTTSGRTARDLAHTHEHLDIEALLAAAEQQRAATQNDRSTPSARGALMASGGCHADGRGRSGSDVWELGRRLHRQ